MTGPALPHESYANRGTDREIDDLAPLAGVATSSPAVYERTRARSSTGPDSEGRLLGGVARYIEDKAQAWRVRHGELVPVMSPAFLDLEKVSQCAHIARGVAPAL
jgi:hypothetical protein